MVGKVVGTAALLSVLALLWCLIAKSGFNPWAMAAGLLVFLVIGALATFEPGEWQRTKR